MNARPATEPPPGATAPPRHPQAPAPGERILSHYRQCFGCGVDHPTGLHMLVTAGDGLTATAQFTVTEHHQGAPGLAHGGLLAAAFDEALGSLNWLLRRPAVTARLETDFIRPVPVDSVLHIEARVVAVVGRKIYTGAQGRLGAVDGPLAVAASALFIAVELEHFAANGRAIDVEAARLAAGTGEIRSYQVNP